MTTKTRKVANIANDIIETISGGPVAGYRNAVINGNFDFWQRGTSLSSSSGTKYLSDRWLNECVGSSLVSSRQAFTLGQTSVPYEPKYFHRTVVTSVTGANNYCIMGQRIEGLGFHANKNVTLSFYAKANTTRNLSVSFAQKFGTGGSPSADVTGIGTTKFNLTTSWQKFTVSTTIPSISGKTLGTNNDNYLALNMWFDAGSSLNSVTNTLGHQSGTFDIAQVQLEYGDIATPFEIRSFGEELTLCQRYYEKSYALDLPPGSTSELGIMLARFQQGYTSVIIKGAIISFKFTTTKRIIPAMTFYSHITGTSGVFYNFASSTDLPITSFNIGQTGGRVWVFESNTAIMGIDVVGHYIADAEI